MDYIILYLVAKVMKLPITSLRVIVGSMIGAVGACVILRFDQIHHGILSIIVNLAISVIMIKVSYRIKHIRYRWNIVLALYLVTLLLGGILTFVFYNSNVLAIWNQTVGASSKKTISVYMLVIAMSVILVTFPYLLTYINTFRSRVTNIFEVTIQLEDKSIVLKGLLDTGNHLREPITGKPVIIIERELVNQVMTKSLMEYTTRLKVIPFHSIGKDDGMMYGIVLDQIVINVNNQEHIHKNVVACLYEGTLSSHKDYQLILHEDLL